MRRLRFAWAFLALGILSILSCSQTSAPAWKGKIWYGYAGGSVKQYDLGNKSDKELFKDASQPFPVKSGEIYFINDGFLKRNVLVRKSTTNMMQFRNVLDMSSDNPEYKEELSKYSVIHGTGISAVLDRLTDPKVSPDGKYLSVTIYGHPGQAFTTNSVGVFDLATGKLVTKFDDKYYGSWTPDGRLVMSGTHKNGASESSLYQPKTPGIFISDAGLQNLTRIDPELDDPSPYHAAVSPDGKKVAFILNDHVWVMGIDGSNPKQVSASDNDNVETYPTWSPDGKSIAAWSYKTFEKNYYTAIAILPANPAKPVVLSNKAAVWPRDAKGYRISGGNGQLSWR